jgi:hypothetical protein
MIATAFWRNKTMMSKVFEWFVAAVFIVALLPCLVKVIIDTLGPVLVLAAVVGLGVGAYRSLERSRPRAIASKKNGGAERTPVLPEGDE